MVHMRGTNGGMRPRLMFSRPKDNGTGSAIQIELHPATIDHPGSIMLEFAKQNSSGYCDVDGYHDGSFDWQHSLKFRVRLGIIAGILGVLRGECEDLTPYGNHFVEIKRKNDTVWLRFNSTASFSSRGDNYYELGAQVDEGDLWSYKMSYTDALTLRLALEAAMDRLAWGD